MWTAEQWAKQKQLAAEERARRRAAAHRRADMFEARGKGPPTGGSHLRTGTKGGGAHCTDAEVARVMMLRENARRSSEVARAGRGGTVADEDSKAVVHVPEVVQPGEAQAPADPSPRPCPGCERGEPHRNEKGQLRPGHTMNAAGRRRGSRNNATKLAIQAMQGAANKAAQRLIRGIDSPNEWVATACAKTIVERTIPPEVLADSNIGGPLIVFPPGSGINIKLQPGDGPAPALPAGVRGPGDEGEG